MARIEGVSARDAGVRVKLARYFTRRQLAQLAGRETERMTEPVEMYAPAPGLLSAYGKLEQATAKLHRVDKRLKVLAELKAATLTNCEYCIDLGSQVARRTGLTDEQLLALPRYRESGLFDEVEKLVLDYAVGMSRTPVEVSRLGKPARALQPGARRRRSGLQRGHGVRSPRDGRPIGTGGRGRGLAAEEAPTTGLPMDD